MRIAVTGSVATDHLMSFNGRFSEQLLPEHLGSLSVSFLVDSLDIRRGGVAANIAFGMACLGVTPTLVASVGDDWADYQAWLVRHGVDVSGVRVSEIAHTARFLCTTDLDQCQIASFYPGAMSEARGIELAPLGPIDLAIVSPNDPEAMARHTQECRGAKVPFVADPSQQLAFLDGAAIRNLVDGAAYLITNEYESALVHDKTGWTADEVLSRVGVRVTTLGAQGVRISQVGEADIEVAVVPETHIADPTGVGDAFRAGFLSGRLRGLDLQRAAQVGSMLATLVLETVGPQEYSLDRGSFLKRIGEAYGSESSDAIAEALTFG